MRLRRGGGCGSWPSQAGIGFRLGQSGTNRLNSINKRNKWCHLLRIIRLMRLGAEKQLSNSFKPFGQLQGIGSRNKISLVCAR